ncbi:MAG: hypothetical protein EOP83_10695 [Verrucomicrobiaceae bacterium]|nr:MAG: hypothetical protein EOP83_10695 [Verrucomicrobiaceae bacterium]
MEVMRSVIVAPERWLNPAHREHRPGMASYAKGGKYLCGSSRIDLTDITATHGFIDVSGSPRFEVSLDQTSPTTRQDGRCVRVNLFKRSAGWSWVDSDSSVKTLISVESSGRHHYGLRVNFAKPVTLARYPEARSEPRLRPSLYGQVRTGTVIGHVSVRGRIHEVFDAIEIL